MSTRQKIKPAQGNSLSIFLIVIPIAIVSWALAKKAKLPLDQLKFLGFATLVAIGTFAPMWWVSFRNVKRSYVIYGVFAFTFLLWWAGSLLGLALLNQLWDHRPVTSHYRKIIRKHEVRGGRGSPKPSCTIWFDKTLFQTEYGPIKFVECEHIVVDFDGIHYQMKNGYFGFAWTQDYSVIKDFKTYTEKLNIAYKAN